MHRLHFSPPPGFVGIPPHEDSFVVNGLLGGDVPHYLDPGAAAGGGHQDMRVLYDGEPIRRDYFGRNREPGDLLRTYMVFGGRF